MKIFIRKFSLYSEEMVVVEPLFKWQQLGQTEKLCPFWVGHILQSMP